MTSRRFLHLAAAGLVLAGSGLASPTVARAAAPAHVAIIVGGVGSACVPWRSGMTGFDVLDAQYGGAFAVTYGQQPPYVGFVFTIAGLGTSRPDTTHYWAYFHDTGGGWQYSSTGGATYHPQPGTVEGWSYVDGQTTAPAPQSASYAAICGGTDPSPPSKPAPTTPTARRTPAASSTSAPVASPAAPASLPRDGVSSTARPTVTARPATRATTPAATAVAASSVASVASEPAASRAATTAAAAYRPSTDRGSSALPTAGTALGLLAVVVIGAAAYRQARRNRHGRAP